MEYAVNAVPSGDEQLQKQIDFANDLLFWLRDRFQDDSLIEDNLIDTRGRILTALYELENPIAKDIKRFVEDHYPQTGLSQSELFSGSHAELSLESELKREIVSSNKIYFPNFFYQMERYTYIDACSKTIHQSRWSVKNHNHHIHGCD
ncbi:hypothetical protein OURE66S_01138 [Oligella ureolytica]